MTVIKRAEAPTPTLPKETTPVEALGGDVVVRGLLLSERMALQAKLSAVRKADTLDQSEVYTILPLLLSLCVLDADGLPIYTQPEWEAFGARHTNQALAVFAVAWRLCGFDEADTKKNLPSSPS